MEEKSSISAIWWYFKKFFKITYPKRFFGTVKA